MSGSETEQRGTSRACGACSLCCIALRVDELGKLAGEPCPKLSPEGGCSIHATRPEVCRAYQCHWLDGGLEEGDRPDRLGGIVDFAPGGLSMHLAVVEATPGAFDASPRLQAIAEAHRDALDVRVSDTRDVLDADRPVRVLQAGGKELRLEGDRVRSFESGRLVGDTRLPLLERWVRRLQLRFQRWRWERLAPRRRRAFDERD